MIVEVTCKIENDNFIVDRHCEEERRSNPNAVAYIVTTVSYTHLTLPTKA